jgi:primosomal protein N' (replication factor Y)
VDAQTALTPQQIALASWMARETLAPLAECISLMLPAGLGKLSDTLYSLTEATNLRLISPRTATEQPQGKIQQRLLNLIHQRGALRGRQIDQALQRVNWKPTADALVRRGILSRQAVLLAPSMRPKTVRTVTLTLPLEQALQALEAASTKRSTATQRRRDILSFLDKENGTGEAAWINAEIGAKPEDLRFLEKHNLVSLGEGETWRDPLAGMAFIPTQPPTLTRDQQTAWEIIQKGIRDCAAGKPVSPFLLHGVTGSGKTEIYLAAAAEVLRQGKQAIVLVPEIAMTPQTTQRFASRFLGQVGILHSKLSEGERYDTWRRARQGKISLALGPRSALFAPLTRIGLVIVDECHDDSYYQDSPPHYHAVQAAVAYARMNGAVCLLGSATPDITSRFRAERQDYTYLNLPGRILAHHQAVKAQVDALKQGMPQEKGVGDPEELSHYRLVDGQADMIALPPVQVVDMRQELKAGNRSIFSRGLQAALNQILTSGEQAILFLNRRGLATYVFCRDCGHTLKCPRCDIPLTLHGPKEGLSRSGLVCHRCDYQRQLPKTCPQCHSSHIRQYGTGTEKVESEVQALLPGVRTLRWDYETTRYKGAHEVILNHFSNRRADILIGTQMIAKGLDLPFVTLVGVVLADVSLNLPDYRAAERTFQVLTQVAGRAGRSPLGGKVILQTFQPEHYAIQAASKHDYPAFYRQELAYRRSLGYPPFNRFVRLEYRHADESRAETAAQELAAKLRGWIEAEGYRSTELIGPAPSYFARAAGVYRWQIILCGPNPLPLLQGRTLGEWIIEVDPPSLL